MEKLLKKFKTKNDFDRFSKILFERMIENKPISDKPMVDGIII